MTDATPDKITVRASAAPGLLLSVVRVLAVVVSVVLAQKFAASAGGAGLALAHIGEIISYATAAATWAWELSSQYRGHRRQVALADSAPIGEVKP